jgi:tRNA(adenine34) deaminase
MNAALVEAEQAITESEVPVGAVIVKDGKIISKAYNRCVSDHDPTAHAEMLAMKDAYQKLGSLEDCTLYVTLEPCAMCTGAMLHLRLPRLVFGAYDAACGCCGSRIDLSAHWFEHSVDTIGGVCESECAELLRDFFQNLRNE